MLLAFDWVNPNSENKLATNQMTARETRRQDKVY